MPLAVRWSFLLWLSAVALGGFETLIVVLTGPAPAAGVAFRALVYAVVVATTFEMRRGRRWARLALTLVLGIIGTLSLIMEPVEWLLAGGSPSAALSSADAVWWLTAAARTLHVAAVWLALPLMYTPAARTYFRAQPSPGSTPPLPVDTRAARRGLDGDRRKG